MLLCVFGFDLSMAEASNAAAFAVTGSPGE
jgi:hypothetical protein